MVLDKLRFRHARQAFRVVRERVETKTDKASRETAYGICSVAADAAGPARLLAWNHGHWMVENGNHHPRDATLGEDASRVRARHEPADCAATRQAAPSRRESRLPLPICSQPGEEVRLAVAR